MIVSLEHDGAPAVRQQLERCVRAGGVVAFPADTLYGLACDPSSRAAIDRIHELKGRPQGKPSAVLFFAWAAMRELLGALGSRTREALGTLLPGPVTVVLSNPEHRYPLACREDPERLGLRLIDGPLAGARCGVFQTSANRSGESAASRFEEIAPEITAGADLTIDGGALHGEPSTVVDLTRLDVDGSWRVLRRGAVSAVELDRRLGAAGRRT